MSGDKTTVPWVGVHHLALITNDMDATVRFWHGVLGADLVATVAVAEFRHYFFKLGATTTVAFFEYRDEHGPKSTDTVVKPAGEFHVGAGQFDHLSLELPDEAALLALQERLRAAGSEATEVVDHGLLRSVYFTDPNGIALEASWWVEAPGASSGYADPRWFSDREPVAAVAELAEGRLAHTPATRLTDSVPAP